MGARAHLASRLARALLASGLVAALAAGCSPQRPTPADARDALRVLRLAGFEDAAVGADRSAAFARVGLPTSASAADAELAWQTALSALTVVYPRASRYAVRVGSTEGPAVELEVDGADARSAVDSDDAARLRDIAAFRAVVGAPELPMTALASAAASIDAENRAAGLVTSDGLRVDSAAELAREWRDARSGAPGVPAPSGSIGDAARAAATRIAKALDASGVEGSEELVRAARTLVADDAVSELRVLAATVEAAASQRPLGSVLALTAAAARSVRGSEARAVASGPVRESDREPSLDVSGTPTGEALPNEVLARVGVAQSDGTYALAWREPDGAAASVAPERWVAYRSPDGTLYWVAGEDGEVALVDRSVPGWAWQLPSAELVDASDPTRTLLTVPLR